MEINEQDKHKLDDIRRHLGELHHNWQNDPECDGHCKMNEGMVGVYFRYPNWSESDYKKDAYTLAKPELAMVEVYSYLFGPTRLHTFNSISEAHEAVMNW